MRLVVPMVGIHHALMELLIKGLVIQFTDTTKTQAPDGANRPGEIQRTAELVMATIGTKLQLAIGHLEMIVGADNLVILDSSILTFIDLGRS